MRTALVTHKTILVVFFWFFFCFFFVESLTWIYAYDVFCPKGCIFFSYFVLLLSLC